MTINKISYKNEKVSILYTENKPDNKTIERSIGSNEKPLPGFLNALLKLRVFVLRMLELPEKDADVTKTTVTSVSFDYSGEREVMGVVISATRKLQHSNGSHSLNTPHKIVEPYAENGKGDKKMLLDPVCIEYLEELIDEAEKYINGERAQEEMKFEEAQKKADDLLSAAEIKTVIIDDPISSSGTFTNIHDIKEADEIKKKRSKKVDLSTFYVKSKGKYVEIAPGFANRLTVLLEQKITLENVDLKKAIFAAGIGETRIFFEKTGNILDILKIEIANHPVIEGSDLVKNVVEETIEALEAKVLAVSKVN